MRWTRIITSQRKFNKNKRQTREGADEKAEVKDRAGVNCQKEQKGKKSTIAIATKVLLPSSNNGFMSDASLWYKNRLKRNDIQEVYKIWL